MMKFQLFTKKKKNRFIKNNLEFNLGLQVEEKIPKIQTKNNIQSELLKPPIIFHSCTMKIPAESAMKDHQISMESSTSST